MTTIASPEYIEKLQADRAALLVACKAADAALCRATFSDPTNRDLNYVIDKCRAAIKKAEDWAPQ